MDLARASRHRGGGYPNAATGGPKGPGGTVGRAQVRSRAAALSRARRRPRRALDCLRPVGGGLHRLPVLSGARGRPFLLDGGAARRDRAGGVGEEGGLGGRMVEGAARLRKERVAPDRRLERVAPRLAVRGPGLPHARRQQQRPFPDAAASGGGGGVHRRLRGSRRRARRGRQRHGHLRPVPRARAAARRPVRRGTAGGAPRPRPARAARRGRRDPLPRGLLLGWPLCRHLG